MKAGKGIGIILVGVLGCFAGQAGAAADGPAKLSFEAYFVPYASSVEPNAPGYTLPLDLQQISNGQIISQLGWSSLQGSIAANGFAVTELCFTESGFERESVTKPYEYLKNWQVPLFVATDTVLHLYHVQFDETLREIEEREFIADMNNLTAALLADALRAQDQLTGDLQEAARRNVAYLAVAQKLLDPNAPVPPAVAETVEAELALIAGHVGFEFSPLFIYLEDYSQYVPRGHYTRSVALERYFQAMMWYGRLAFLLKGSDPWGQNAEALISPHDADIQTLEAALLSAALRNVQVGSRTGLQVWDRLYRVTAFYVGLADDLTPYDYLWALDQVFQNGWAVSGLANAGNLAALRTQLTLLPSPKIFGGTGNPTVPPGAPPEYLYEILDKTKGLRLMGQRFVPDSYMFQHLVFPQVDLYTGDPHARPFTKADDGNRRYVRGYPRGLDVMALLGSKQALRILIDDGDTDYVYFWTRFGELRQEFDELSPSEWNRNLYWSWLYCLKALVTDLPQGYPNFMRTAVWQKKSLNAALASWTELRHDTILYAKQSYTPVGRSAPLPPPPGYIEPVPEFFGRLQALARMTRVGLADMQALSDTAVQRLSSLEDLLGRLVEIAGKELQNQPLSAYDTSYLAGLPTVLESLVTGVDARGISTILVTDVHTNAVESEKKVVEEAVGRVDLIVVACPAADGSIFLAAGPVLSYYEFKQPMSDRLTDEAWRQLLDQPTMPARPTWYQPLFHSMVPMPGSIMSGQ
jgi:hypothetical protein